MNPDLDLDLHRTIRAPKEAVWRAWTDSSELSRWFVPAPTLLRVDRLEVRPGGGLVTTLSDDGENYAPHIDAVFLVVEENRRLVWTNAVDSAWRPQRPQPVPMTAEIVFGDHPDGTDYRIIVRHGSPADRDTHAELGFFEGWGTVTEQLVGLVER